MNVYPLDKQNTSNMGCIPKNTKAPVTEPATSATSTIASATIGEGGVKMGLTPVLGGLPETSCGGGGRDWDADGLGAAGLGVYVGEAVVLYVGGRELGAIVVCVTKTVSVSA